MSIQNGQPTSEATLTAASVVSRASIFEARPNARSNPMYAANTSGWCAVTAMGRGSRPNFFSALVGGADVGRGELRGHGSDPAHDALLTVWSSTTRRRSSNANVTKAAMPAVATAVVIGRSVPS